MLLESTRFHNKEDGISFHSQQTTISIFFSLMKDMTGKEDQFRGPAIRALCSITDVSIKCCLILWLYHK